MAKLVLSLDPSKEILSRWNFEYSAEGCDRLLREIISTAAKKVDIFKLQIAFFEQFGWRGIQVMQGVVELLKSMDKFVILDVKRNDIENTMQAYCSAYTDIYNVDAVTLSPYFGFAVLKRCLDIFRTKQRQVFVVSVPSTSLTENRGIFSAVLDGDPVYQKINDFVDSYNRHFLCNMGVVIGNHNYTPSDKFNGSVLVPGCFTQGNKIEVLKGNLGRVFDKTYIAVGRYILSNPAHISSKIDEVKLRLL